MRPGLRTWCGRWLVSDADVIRAAVSCDEYIGRYVDLKRGVGLCPFHDEKTPSFRVHSKFYKCFGCGAAGDVLNFAMRLHSLSFGKAIRLLAGEYGVVPGEAPSRYARAVGERLDSEADEWWRGIPKCEYTQALTIAERRAWYRDVRDEALGAAMRDRIREWQGFETAVKAALCTSTKR